MKKGEGTIHINMKLTPSFLSRVDEYGEKYGLNRTATMVYLCNKALESDKAMEQLPDMISQLVAISKQVN